jgi:protein O-mannosyl-transferase
LCIGIALIVLLTAAVYSPVVKQGFFNWDDPKHVRAVWKPSWERARTIVADFDLQYSTVAYYIPLHFLSLMADQALLGNVERPRAWISKVANVAYHAANASLVFALLLALGTGRMAALFGALVFALHPVQVGTVAWVVERKNVLSTFFYLSAFLVFLRFCRTERFSIGVGVVVIFAAGLLSKPSVVTLPVAMVAALVLLPDLDLHRKKPWVLSGIVLALALTWGLFVVSTEVSYPGILPPWFMRPLLAAGVIWFYLAKLVYPRELLVVYPRWDVDAHAWEFLLLFFGLTLVCAALAYAHHRRQLDPVSVWGIVLFLVNLLPVSGLAAFGYMGHSFVADHFMYLPFVGLAVVVARCADRLMQAVDGRPRIAIVLSTGALAVLAVLAVLSVNQVMLWRDPALLWEASLRVNKKSTAIYLNYGALCMDRGQLDQALSLLSKAAELSPRFDASYNNMGRILLSQGRKDEARQVFHKSLEANPKGVVPRVMLARILTEENKPDEALRFLQESVEANSADPTLRTQLAQAFRQLGKEDQALKELDRAIAIAPTAPAPAVAKAHILLTRGRPGEAMVLLRKALKHGSDADAHNLLGAALAQEGNIAQAQEEFAKAYRLNPALPGIRDNMANALMDMKEYGKARAVCSAAEKSGMPCSRETLERLRSALPPTENISP